MKNRTVKVALISLLGLSSWLFACGQDQADSLYYYLEIAARNNPTVLQKYAEYEAALQKVPQAGSLPDPELSMGIFLSPMELLGGNQLADIRLMQMFPWFGVIKAGKDEMSLMAKAKFETFRDVKLQVFYDVQRNWYELGKIRENIRISEKNLELLRVIERLAIIKLQAETKGTGLTKPGSLYSGKGQDASEMEGMGDSSSGSYDQESISMSGTSMGSFSGGSGLTDVYRIQIEAGDLQNKIELLRDEYNTITARINGILNRPPDARIEVPDTLIAEKFTAELSTPDELLEKTPMLEMISLERQSLEARKTMVAKMGYPMLGVGLNYSIISPNAMSTSQMNGKDMIMPMVTATIPVYRKKYKAMKAEVDYLASANEQNFMAVTNSLKTEYYESIQLYQDSRRRMKLYAEQYKLAAKSMEIMLKSYSAAGSELTDLLRVRQQILDYGYKKAEAVADFNTSIARIKRLTGLTYTE